MNTYLKNFVLSKKLPLYEVTVLQEFHTLLKRHRICFNAGKSSILVALMRMKELESGCIMLDGVDISSLGLHELRSSIAVIPQEPVLFQGTVRYACV